MIYFVYPRLRKLSGAERLILRLASYTAQLGAPVTILTHYFDDQCAPALAPHVQLVQTGDRLELFRGSPRTHYLNAPFEYLNSVRLLKWIREDADAVTFFGPPSLPALAASSFLRSVRAPKLYFCYEPPRFIYDDAAQVTARLGWSGTLARPFFGLYKMLDRVMVRRADALLANSHFGAARLRAAYGRDAAVITHGADFTPPSSAAVEEVRAQFTLDDVFVWLTVNFLHPRKRVDLFLRAFAQFHAQWKNSVALVVGAGPERDALAQLAYELQIDDATRFTGFISDEQLPALYAASDLYVHTGKNESFGLSVLEASAAGLAVVAVNEGGPREIVVDEKTGLLVDATPDALVRAALRLAQAAPRRAQMGALAKQRVASNYAWERGAREFLHAAQQLNSNISHPPLAPTKP